LISIQFDDIIYKLQRFGGASEYWTQITRRVESDLDTIVTRAPTHKLLRWIPSACASMVFHSSHFRTTYSKKAATVSTVHDMNYELGYLPAGLGSKINILERKRSYFTAQHLVCISESTKRELLQVYPQLEGRCPIEVIHHGCEFISSTAEHREQATALGKYILYVGGRQSYKRFDDLLHAFNICNLKSEGFRIICTGAPFSEVELSEIRALNLTSKVVSLGKVNQSYLSALYESAHCLVYPSLHEGFGMPLIEAMQHHCPVVACETSCIPEIAANAALLVPKESPEAIAAAIFHLNDPEVRLKIIASGKRRSELFSWDASANAHLKVYRQAAKLL